MNTATITWISYQNFGTYLQAYALQNVIQSMGHTNTIIYDNYFAKYSKPPKSVKDLVIKIYGQFAEILRNPNSIKVRLAYRYFLHNHLNIDYCVKTTQGLGSKYDAFICGSDQIWSPYLEFEPYYYLGFNAKRKIAYAPSIGTGLCDENYEKYAIPLIEQIDFISTREEVGSQLLRNYIDKPIETVLDPTLLLDRTQWIKLAETKVKDKEKYLLCYFLSPNKWYIDYAKQYANEKGLKLYVFATDTTYKHFADKLLYVGPQEFLSYIYSAEMIFTDSFHATIFSIQFHRNFLTFKRFTDGSGVDQNARLYNLFDKLQINNHFISKDDIQQNEMSLIVDWDHVDILLNKYRNDSLLYLNNSLKTND